MGKNDIFCSVLTHGPQKTIWFWVESPSGGQQVSPPPQSSSVGQHWFRSTWAVSFIVILQTDHYSTAW